MERYRFCRWRYKNIQESLLEALIQGIQQDVQMLAQHPVPTNGFAGLTMLGKTYTEKAKANEALRYVKELAQSADSIPIGVYCGFALSAFYSPVHQNIMLELRGRISYQTEFGKDNLIRLDNLLQTLPKRLEAAQESLADIHQQRAAAEAQLQLPFPQEAVLREKGARLAELNTELNLEKQPAKTQEVNPKATPHRRTV